MKIPGLTTVRRFTVQPMEKAMNALVLSVVKKFLASAGKSLLTAVIAWLTLAAGVPAPADAVGMQLWAAFLLGVRTLISVLGRVAEQLAAPAKPAA